MSITRKFAVVVTVLLATGGLSACGSTATPGAAPEKTGSNRPAVTPGKATPKPATETGSSDESVAFGSTRTWPDGIAVTVSKSKKFTPSDTSMGKGKAYLKYTVVLVNGTGKVFDPGMFTASAQSSNVEGDQVFDSAKGVGGSPSTKLLKGREAKFDIAFGVEDAKDVVMEVRPSFEHDSVLFN